jgi:hypothetical protein
MTTMNLKTANKRALNQTLRALVAAADAAKAAKAIADGAKAELERIEKETIEVLVGAFGGQAGSQWSVAVNGSDRMVRLGESASVSAFAAHEDLAAFARQHGLKVSAPVPESCSTATLRSAHGKGVDISAVAEVTVSPVLAVI